MASARAVLLLLRLHRLELADHVLKKQQRAVVHARQAGAEAAVEAALLVLALDLLLLLLPVHAEGRIGEEVVERVGGASANRSSVKMSPKRTFSPPPLWLTSFMSMSEAAVAKARLL